MGRRQRDAQWFLCALFVGRLTARPGLDRSIEATLRRDREVVAVTLFLLLALAWIYLWRDAASMRAMGSGLSGMPGAPAVGTLVPIFLMWAIMMVGMMLPAASPTILLYATLVRKNGERGTVLPAVWVFTSGYILVWTVFSLAISVLQLLLQELALLTSMMASASPELSAAILVCAGVYQWSPLKKACLRKCQNPMEFFITRWRPGAHGAFRMGVEHGMYCVGCCWMLMALLFVAGVMNLLWIALIAGFVLAEKVLPSSRITSAIASIALVLSGLVLLVTS